MTKKINTITDEQKAQFPVWVDKWVKIGLSTDPIDFGEVKEYVQKIYEIIGKKRPMVLYAESPKAAIAIGLRHTLNREPTSLECKESIKDLYGGNGDASGCAYISFFRDVMDWKDCSLENYSYYEKICTLCNTVWWGDKVAVVVDRPKFIKLDDQGSLHAEEGPAVKFRDGYCIYSWHGTTVPKEWLTTPKDQLDASLALTWENIEQRRCLSEIVGWDNVLKQLPTTVINADGDPEIGTLVEVELPDIGKERFLRVKCGTGRYFALPVPPEMKTALEAQSWTWGMDVNEFIKPEVRT